MEWPALKLNKRYFIQLKYSAVRQEDISWTRRYFMDRDSRKLDDKTREDSRRLEEEEEKTQREKTP